jgi:hypothetical protein
LVAHTNFIVDRPGSQKRQPGFQGGVNVHGLFLIEPTGVCRKINARQTVGECEQQGDSADPGSSVNVRQNEHLGLPAGRS